MNYVVDALLGYSLLGISGVIDKFLLTKSIRHPVAFSFFVGIAGPVSLILAPFGFHLIHGKLLLIALASGVAFTYASFFFYSAMAKTSISRILPIEGGLVPLFTLILSYSFLGERLDNRQLWAFVFLVLGAILISLKREKTIIRWSMISDATIAAILFALSFTLSKYVYIHTSFINGLIWTRFGVTLAAATYLISKNNRNIIFATGSNTKPKNFALYYGAHGLGALGGLLQNYAIAIGSVTIVNSLAGAQFVLLLGLTTFLSRYYPNILEERITGWVLVQKLAAIMLITVGLVFLHI
jgi:drug/metabolite transporter (DMT)-like permease